MVLRPVPRSATRLRSPQRQTDVRIAALALLMIAFPLVALGARLRTSSLPQQASASVSVSVVPIADGVRVWSDLQGAVANLGTVSGISRAPVEGVEIVRRAHSYVVTTYIGLRATAASGALGGAVSIVAFLDSVIPGVNVRIDGVELSGAPSVVESGVPLNVVTRHRLEIEIPNDVNPARIPSAIPLELGALNS